MFLCVATEPDRADRDPACLPSGRGARPAQTCARACAVARAPAAPRRLFNEWLQKSQADLALLTSELPTGPYPYAGIPWFSAAFGRDAIITALQTLWLDSSLARGVLRFLAQHQATETSSFKDSAPGKIMHETRKGEMTALRELPFGEYYGGVDTTPLFVVLAGAYAERTGDMEFDRSSSGRRCARRWTGSSASPTPHPHGFVSYARARADRARQPGLEGQR